MRLLSSFISTGNSQLLRYVWVISSAMVLGACAHNQPQAVSKLVPVDNIRVIGIPNFKAQKMLDIHQERSIYALLGLSGQMVKHLERHNRQVQYNAKAPELLGVCIHEMRAAIKKRLHNLGYRIKDLDMTYWQAQSAYRRGQGELAGIDALLDIRVQQLGYYSISHKHPYKPGIIFLSELITTKGRHVVSSDAYNIGFDKITDKEPVQLFSIDYIAADSHIKSERYFYQDFDALLASVQQSAEGLRHISKVAGESVAGELDRRLASQNIALHEDQAAATNGKEATAQ